jgi:hypothetical protein
MLSVAAVTDLVCDFLGSEVLNRQEIVAMQLLHDIGNMLKFDFTRLDLFDEEDRLKLTMYKSAQQKMGAKYGPNPDEVTLQIIQEVTGDGKTRYFVRREPLGAIGRVSRYTSFRYSGVLLRRYASWPIWAVEYQRANGRS